MKILYLGVFDGKQWRSEYPMAEGLKKQGHTLLTCNFRSKWPGTVLRAWRKHQHEIDLVFVQNGIPFKEHWLSQMHSKPLVFLASEYALSSAVHILNASRKPDLTLAHSEQTFQYCQSHGLKARRIHHAYNHAQYRTLELPFKYDVCFVGGMSPRRQHFLKQLENQGLKTCIAKTGDAHQINTIYNQSKVVLHIHAKDEPYLPTRLFEVLPTQGCLLIEDLKDNADPELGDDFYESFTSPEEMLHKINHLLEHESERQARVDNAQRLAPEHTWEARMKTYSVYFQELLADLSPNHL